MLNEMKSRYAGKKLALVFLIVSFAANIAVAQRNIDLTKLNSSAKKNLVMAINSDNAGLKRSAVYFAGYYKINEAVDPLINLLNSSSADISLKTLAAYSLHRIGSEECIEALKEAVHHNSNKKLCFKCRLLYQDLIQTSPEFSYQ